MAILKRTVNAHPTEKVLLNKNKGSVRAGPGARVTPGDRATADTEEKPSLAGAAEYSKGSAKNWVME